MLFPLLSTFFAKTLFLQFFNKILDKNRSLGLSFCSFDYSGVIMRLFWIFLFLFAFSVNSIAADKTDKLNNELEVKKHHNSHSGHKKPKKHSKHKHKNFHVSKVYVKLPNKHPGPLEFYPTALIADHQVVTYIAGTPVISSPYLGARPAFDGSDYIVNISSINRDIRLMEQRRNLYKAYRAVGYVPPDVPVIAVSGKVIPVLSAGSNYFNQLTNNIDLGADELDIAAIANKSVEAYMAIAYNSASPGVGVQRVAKSGLSLNMGFVNFGNPDKSPLYLTAGQIYVPFGRYSTSMVSPTLPTVISRTLARPLIVGYKSEEKIGPLFAAYIFSADTTLGSNAVGGFNAAYIFSILKGSGEIGASFISSMNNAYGMQYTAAMPNTTFGGFGSLTNGSENVKKIPAVDVHGNVSFGRYSLTAEWVSAIGRFRTQDLSYNGVGALPQAGQVEAGLTFRSFDKPATLSVGYQWSTESLALNIPQQRVNAVYNISIWKDTLESLEYRHDFDYGTSQYANGANAPLFPPNANSIGTGGGADTVLLQLGVFF